MKKMTWKGRKGKGRSAVAVVLGGIGIGLALALILVMITAKLMDGGTLQMEQKTVAVTVIWAVTAVISSFVTAKRLENRKFWLATLCAAGLLAIAAALHALLVTEAYVHVLPIALAILIGGIIGGALGAKGKRGKYRV